mmetsp:Transcript_4464/g.12397  ORF Transcript_4464/g.12397 Transcript_4464/m.12397 type:complete len:662 (-) Transcript_4464:1379-3364(-)
MDSSSSPMEVEGGLAEDDTTNNVGTAGGEAATVGEEPSGNATDSADVAMTTTADSTSTSIRLKRKRESNGNDGAVSTVKEGEEEEQDIGGDGGADILSQIGKDNAKSLATHDDTATDEKPSLQTLAEHALEQERKENAEKAAAAVAAAAVGVGIIDTGAAADLLPLDNNSVLAEEAPPKKQRRRSRPIKSFDDPDKQDRLEDYRRKKRERQKRYRQEEKAREAAGEPPRARGRPKKKTPIDPNQPIVVVGAADGGDDDDDDGEDGIATPAVADPAAQDSTQDWRIAIRVPTLVEDAASAEPKGYRMSEEDTTTWNVNFIPLTVSTIEQPPLVKGATAATTTTAKKAKEETSTTTDDAAAKATGDSAASEAAKADGETKPEDEELIDINFAATIGCVDGKKMRWVKNQSKIWLPPEYNQNSREYRAKVIGPLFAAACAKTGSKVMMYGWEPLKGNAKFGCYRSRTQQYKSSSHHKTPSAPNSLAPESMTRKPQTHDELCRFSFHVYWDENVERWYIKRFGAGCRCHTGHPRMDPYEASQRGQEPTADEIRTLHMERGPYSISHPLFTEIANSIKEPDDSIHFRRLLLDFKEYLQQKLMIQKQEESQDDKKKKPAVKKEATPAEDEEDDEEDAEISDSSDDEGTARKEGAATTTPTGTKMYQL